MRTPVSKSVMVPMVKTVHPNGLNPAPYNPTEISKARMEGLKGSIRTAGFIENVVVQNESKKYGRNIIVGGHQRIAALREICFDDHVEVPPVPAVFLDLTDREAMKLNQALNARRGEPNAKLLSEMLVAIQEESPILPQESEVMGFENDELSKLLALSEPIHVNESNGETSTFGRSVTLGLVFHDTRERDAVKVKLDELAAAGKKTTGEVVAMLLGKAKR